MTKLSNIYDVALILRSYSEKAVLWPLVASRLASAGMLTGYHILKRQHELPTRNILPAVILEDIYDTGENIFFALASQAGRFDIAPVISHYIPGLRLFCYEL